MDTEDEKIIAQILEYLDVKNSKRIFSKSVGKDLQSLPSLYINLDEKYMMACVKKRDVRKCNNSFYHLCSGKSSESLENCGR